MLNIITLYVIGPFMKKQDKIQLALNELGLKSPPKCYCGNDLEFYSKFKHITIYGGWRSYCSKSCMYNSPEVKEKRKQTMLDKYGVSTYALIQERKPLTEEQKKRANEKRKKTHLEKYGTEHFSKTEEYISKRTNTNLERYGVENTYSLVKNRNSWFSTEEGKEWSRSEKNPAKNKDNQILWRMKRLSKRVTDERFISSLMSNDRDIFISYIKSIAEESDNRFTLSKKIGISYPYLNAIFRLYNMFDMYLSPDNYSISNGEKEVYDFIKELGESVIPSHRKLLGGLELDIFLPEKKIAIEYNGIYWHSEYTGTKDQKYHLNKTQLCEDNGVQLFQIYDSEWNDPIKQTIWKSILRVKLGYVTNKIFARNCTVQQINSVKSRQFLEINHLEGFVGAEEHYGLFYNSELVSVMSFGKSRFKKNEYEITRFATKLDTVVVGGRSKLLKCYKKDAPLISYANRRFSSILTNNLSEKYEYTSPSWYGFNTKDYELKHRIAFQKHKLKNVLDSYNDSISVFDNMIENGYDRIWDSGNIKFYLK